MTSVPDPVKDVRKGIRTLQNAAIEPLKPEGFDPQLAVQNPKLETTVFNHDVAYNSFRAAAIKAFGQANLWLNKALKARNDAGEQLFLKEHYEGVLDEKKFMKKELKKLEQEDKEKEKERKKQATEERKKKAAEKAKEFAQKSKKSKKRRRIEYEEEEEEEVPDEGLDETKEVDDRDLAEHQDEEYEDDNEMEQEDGDYEEVADAEPPVLEEEAPPAYPGGPSSPMSQLASGLSSVSLVP